MDCADNQKQEETMPERVECADGTIIEFEGGQSRVVRSADDPNNPRQLERRMDDLEARQDLLIRRMLEGKT